MKNKKVKLNKYEEDAKEAQTLNKKLMDCERKKPYKTLEQASEDTNMEVYKCPHCGLYHRRSGITKLVNHIRKIKKDAVKEKIKERGIKKNIKDSMKNQTIHKKNK